jgi:hypothetical protein
LREFRDWRDVPCGSTPIGEEKEKCEMIDATSKQALQAWEEPSVVLERSLEAQAQNATPGGSVLGPLCESSQGDNAVLNFCWDF